MDATAAPTIERISFRQSSTYRRTYDALSTAFLSLGDAFVNQALKLRPQV
jgi:hypothetical protein